MCIYFFCSYSQLKVTHKYNLKCISAVKQPPPGFTKLNTNQIVKPQFFDVMKVVDNVVCLSLAAPLKKTKKQNCLVADLLYSSIKK